KYGSVHKFAINTAPEAVRAMSANFKEFANDFRNGFYRVVVGSTEIKETELDLRVGKSREIHIYPVAAGAKNSGGLKIIAGLALLTPFAIGFAGALSTGATIGLAAETA